MINRAAPLRPVGIQPGQLPQPSPALSHPTWQPAQLLKHLRELEENILLLKAVKDEVGVLFSLEGTRESYDPLLQTTVPGFQDFPSSLAATSTKPASPDGGEQSVVGDEHQLAEDGVRDLGNDGVPNSYYADSTSEGTTKNPSGLELLRTAVVNDVDMDAGSMGLDARRLAAVHAAKSLSRHVRYLLAPFGQASSSIGGSDKSDMVALLVKKRLKLKRNRRWRSKHRRHAAIALQKEKAEFETIDAQADAWRARQIANDLSKRKMEHMRVIAEQKAKEERLRRAQEQEMVLLVEKLHELRSLRIQKLKKQGQFFPDEDNEFLERIRLAVEEEERQAAAAADTSAAATAIANASVAAKSATSGMAAEGLNGPGTKVLLEEKDGITEPDLHTGPSENSAKTQAVANQDQREHSEGFQFRGLPPEFYHYFYGSSFDLGTLIEVRRSWDAFIVPAGGSRIPGHWVQAPFPADAVWGSYLVNPPE